MILYEQMWDSSKVTSVSKKNERQYMPHTSQGGKGEFAASVRTIIFVTESAEFLMCPLNRDSLASKVANASFGKAMGRSLKVVWY